MFCAGKLDEEWMLRLEDMTEISELVRSSLGEGENCSEAWETGFDAAKEMGRDENLMGMRPEQARFLGHSVGLELDETPVIAKGSIGLLKSEERWRLSRKLSTETGQ